VIYGVIRGQNTYYTLICPYKNAKLRVIVMDEFGYTWDLMKCPLL